MLDIALSFGTGEADSAVVIQFTPYLPKYVRTHKLWHAFSCHSSTSRSNSQINSLVAISV